MALRQQDTLTSIGLLILRVSLGGMMLTHGIPKLMKFGELSSTFADPLGMGSQLSLISAIGAEVVCAVLLILGFATPVVAIPLAFTMLVAFGMVHASDAFAVKEKAALYLAGFVTLIFTGGGRFALYPLVAKLFSRKKSTKTKPQKGE